MGRNLFIERDYFCGLAAAREGALLDQFEIAVGMGAAATLRNFRQELDTIQGGGYADALAVGLFYSYDRRLTQGPATGADAQSCGQHDHEFELGAGLERAIGIKKDAGGAQIAGQAFVLGTVGLAHLNRETHWLTGFGATVGSFGLHFRHEV
jgi:hypothetical protein